MLDLNFTETKRMRIAPCTPAYPLAGVIAMTINTTKHSLRSDAAFYIRVCEMHTYITQNITYIHAHPHPQMITLYTFFKHSYRHIIHIYCAYIRPAMVQLMIAKTEGWLLGDYPFSDQPC